MCIEIIIYKRINLFHIIVIVEWLYILFLFLPLLCYYYFHFAYCNCGKTHLISTIVTIFKLIYLKPFFNIQIYLDISSDFSLSGTGTRRKKKIFAIFSLFFSLSLFSYLQFTFFFLALFNNYICMQWKCRACRFHFLVTFVTSFYLYFVLQTHLNML